MTSPHKPRGLNWTCLSATHLSAYNGPIIRVFHQESVLWALPEFGPKVSSVFWGGKEVLIIVDVGLHNSRPNPRTCVWNIVLSPFWTPPWGDGCHVGHPALTVPPLDAREPLAQPFHHVHHPVLKHVQSVRNSGSVPRRYLAQPWSNQ